MYTLKQLAEEKNLSEEEIGNILKIPKSLIDNGLENYQFNEPMREYLIQQIERSGRFIDLNPTPVLSPPFALSEDTTPEWKEYQYFEDPLMRA